VSRYDQPRHEKIITRYPSGFLSMLGVQSDGEAPNRLSQTVQSVINIAPYIYASRYAVGGGATNATLVVGPTFTNTNNGPNAGELWVVGAISVVPTAALAAATTFTYQPMLVTSGNTVPLGDPVTSTVGERKAATLWTNGDLIMNPGDQIGVWIGGAAGVATAFQVNERVFVATF
jgi:hypothetical protein